MSDRHLFPQLPETTCVYGRYDTSLLTPDTPETECRLRELGWTRDIFFDRTVLDIGCNSGILSIFALQLGARHVKAVDPTDASVQVFSKVLQHHEDLNVTLEQSDLSKLDPRENVADIVLFMEVMHWAVDQGMTIPQVIERLWMMTGQILFIEFPWSVNEPSIQAQTKLTEETYSASLILEELGKAFAHVEIVSFMHYFGLLGNAKRVLVRATGPRPEYGIVTKFPNTFSAFTLGERSSNYIAPMLSPTGMRMFKRFSPHSALQRLSLEAANALIGAIVAANPKYLVLPTPTQGSYVIEQDGIRAAVFPLIPRHRINMAEFDAVSDADLIAATINLRRDLRNVKLPESLGRDESLCRNDQNDAKGFDLSVITGRNDPHSTLQQMFKRGLETYDAEATEICHCDLQEGNVIIAINGTVHIVDLDGLAFGTAFTDGICAMIWAGALPDSFESTVTALEADEGRKVTLSDCGIALIILMHWLQAIAAVHTEEAKANVRRARRALLNFSTWWERRQLGAQEQ